MSKISRPASAAEACNHDCLYAIDRHGLRKSLDRAGAEVAALVAARPNLFADAAVFVSPAHATAMARVVTAVERVVATPDYQAAMLAGAPPIAGFTAGPRGVFLSYDFHVAPHGPQLIEVNTNAGGCLLAAAAARAQEACCRQALAVPGLPGLEDTLFAMFMAEWRLQRGEAPLRRVVIVDDAPETQFLYAEFLMFRELFRSRGLSADIVDARALVFRDGRLWAGDGAVDLVYNRLCDFYFEQPEHAALRQAYLAGAAVVTPHPRAHALYADKRALVRWTDAAQLQEWHVPADIGATLRQGIPSTTMVTAEAAETLWAQRSRLFFKPTAGYGSKAAYRGDKLTKRVWQEILGQRYVAQELVPPSERRMRLEAGDSLLKVDFRNFVYDGSVQYLSARLYRGQTTNFQTPGGGLSAVFLLPEEAVR